MPDFPVREIAYKGMVMPVVYWKQVLHFAWPLFPFFAIDTIYISGLASDAATETIETSFSFIFIKAIAQGLCASLVAVNLHRVFLLDYDQAMQAQPYQWRERHFHFLVSSVGIGIIGALFLIPIMALSALLPSMPESRDGSGVFGSIMDEIGWTLLMFPLYPILSRLLLLLPAIAVESGARLTDVWRLSRGYSFQLALVICILPLIPYAISSILYLFDWAVFTILATLVTYGISAVEVCLLSLSYKWLVEESNYHVGG